MVSRSLDRTTVPTAHAPDGRPERPGWWPHIAHLSAEPDLNAGGTLSAAWAANWRAEPEREVLHDARFGWVRAGELDALVVAAQTKLTEAGVATGNRVLLSAPNGLELVVAHAAALSLGAIVVPTNGAYRKAEVQHVVADCQPAVAVAADDTWRPWVVEACPTTICWSPATLLDQALLEASSTDGSDTAACAAEPEAPQNAQNGADQSGADPVSLSPNDVPKPDSAALIGYTSGTTGSPKGAVLSHANLLASVRALEAAWRWTADDVLVLALPLFHMHGLGVGLHGSLTVGARVVLVDGFSASTVLEAVEAHQATLFYGVPTMYQRLVEADGVEALSSLRLCVAGSAPLPAELHARIGAATGQRVLERYGMTETVMLVSNPYAGDRRAGTVGFPLPGVELKLANPTTDTEEAAHVGEVLVRGPNVFGGYWNQPEATAAAFDDEGWFATGDLGGFDDDGYLRLVGRSKELIISGGFNVHPREVEEVVATHPDVLECAVAGVPDERWGEAVAAWVVADRQLTTAEVREFVGERLAHFKRPQQVFCVDSLPRNALGKVQRHLLAASGGD